MSMIHFPNLTSLSLKKPNSFGNMSTQKIPLITRVNFLLWVVLFLKFVEKKCIEDKVCNFKDGISSMDLNNTMQVVREDESFVGVFQRL